MILHLLLIAPAVVVIRVGDLAWRPWKACRSCKGRKGRGIGSTARAFNRCGRCDGRGEVPRLGARWVNRTFRNREI